MKTRNAVFASLLLAAAVCASAQAQSFTTTGSVAVTNDYLFRGLSQTGQDPALQAGVEVAHSSGFYAGAWGSNISWLSDLSSADVPISSSLEADLYLGFRHTIGEKLNFDAGIYTYYYPGDYPHGFTRPYTTELYVGLGYGPFTAKYSYALTNLFGFSDSDGSGYLDLGFNYEIAPQWTLNLHAGHQSVKNFGDASYTDWKVGVTRALDGGWSVALGYYDTNADELVYTNPQGDYVGRATGVLTVTKSF